MENFLGGIIFKPHMELVDIGRRAYNIALAPHHPWFIVPVANLAILAFPYRKTFVQSIREEQSRMRGYEYTEE